MIKFCPKCGQTLVCVGKGLKNVSLFGCRSCDILYEQPPDFSGEETDLFGLKKRSQKFSNWKKQQNSLPPEWQPTK
jgi:DNA-directed RNA polymerase subunit M/transcription elongation factor TFIIS